MVTFQVFLTPLVFWLWAGGFIMAFGTVIAMWPNVRERAAIAAVVRTHVSTDPEPVAVPGGD
jgi:cytochrome c-type biogenesis protein CcmF